MRAGEVTHGFKIPLLLYWYCSTKPEIWAGKSADRALLWPSWNFFFKNVLSFTPIFDEAPLWGISEFLPWRERRRNRLVQKAHENSEELPSLIFVSCDKIIALNENMRFSFLGHTAAFWKVAKPVEPMNFRKGFDGSRHKKGWESAQPEGRVPAKAKRVPERVPFGQAWSPRDNEEGSVKRPRHNMRGNLNDIKASWRHFPLRNVGICPKDDFSVSYTWNHVKTSEQQSFKTKIGKNILTVLNDRQVIFPHLDMADPYAQNAKGNK